MNLFEKTPHVLVVCGLEKFPRDLAWRNPVPADGLRAPSREPWPEGDVLWCFFRSTRQRQQEILRCKSKVFGSKCGRLLRPRKLLAPLSGETAGTRAPRGRYHRNGNDEGEKRDARNDENFNPGQPKKLLHPSPCFPVVWPPISTRRILPLSRRTARPLRQRCACCE